MIKSAIMSECARYRYELRREWDASLPPMLFIMLNPSTADADKDDPTIRRCINRAQEEGFGSLIVVNLFGLRSPDPKSLTRTHDPVGPENDQHIARALSECQFRGGLTVAAWGAGGIGDRSERVINMGVRAAGDLFCLGLTKSGQPRHPLYIAKAQALVKWRTNRVPFSGNSERSRIYRAQ